MGNDGNVGTIIQKWTSFLLLETCHSDLGDLIIQSDFTLSNTERCTEIHITWSP